MLSTVGRQVRLLRVSFRTSWKIGCCVERVHWIVEEVDDDDSCLDTEVPTVVVADVDPPIVQVRYASLAFASFQKLVRVDDTGRAVDLVADVLRQSPLDHG